RNLAIIAEPDALLICDLSSSQGVKRLAQGHAQAKAGAGEGSGLKDHRAFFRRWLMVNALPLWWALGADRDVGGFHDGLDAEGAPTGLPHRARVQTRQTFAYARAGALGWTGPWREAVAHGAEHLARAFVRPDGLHRTLVGAGGAPLDERAFLYDQAFALLALAERGGECEEEALGLLAALERVFRHSRGGFAEPDGERFLSNPLMHLFEASLAWTERRGAKGPWRALAEELAALALERLIDPGTGALAEAYNPAWRPLEETAVRVWPGHQFEWTWLLTRWMRLGGGAPALEAARRLHDAGNRGVVSGGLVANAMDGAFRIVDRAGRLWPQTERVKAALGLAAFASGDQSRVLEAEAAEAAGVLRRYLSVETPGLWVDVIDATGTLMPGAAPASSFYHLIGAAEALIAGAAEEVETSGEGPISLAR
ncbi:MAG: AGE family epimerase/isomerase, partial [Caulobacteraceae bacterium]